MLAVGIYISYICSTENHTFKRRVFQRKHNNDISFKAINQRRAISATKRNLVYLIKLLSIFVYD